MTTFVFRSLFKARSNLEFLKINIFAYKHNLWFCKREIFCLLWRNKRITTMKNVSSLPFFGLQLKFQVLFPVVFLRKSTKRQKILVLCLINFVFGKQVKKLLSYSVRATHTFLPRKPSQIIQFSHVSLSSILK